MTRGPASAWMLATLFLACAMPAFAGRGRARRAPHPGAALQQAAQRDRLQAVRAQLRARLPQPPEAAAPFQPAPEERHPGPGLPPAPDPAPSPRLEGDLALPARPSHRLIQFILLLLALCQLAPDADAQAQAVPGFPGPNQTLPGVPEFAFGAVPDPADLVVPLRAAGDPVLQFEQSLAEALDRHEAAPDAGQASEQPPSLAQALDFAQEAARPGPLSLPALRSRLQRLQRWTAQVGGHLDAPSAAHLARLGAMAQGLDALAASQQSGRIDPAVAADLANLASNLLTSVVNAFRVDTQARTLALYPALAAQTGARTQEALAQFAGPDPDAAAARIPAPPMSVPRAYRNARKACCDAADLAAQVGIQRVLGASGAANVAAYIVATEAAAEVVGLDLRSANASLPKADREALAALDLTAASAAALGSLALVPPPGAAGTPPAPWTNVTAGFAPRCESFDCPNPIRDVQARVAAETLAGSIMNVIGYALYSTSVQLSLTLRGAAAAPAGAAAAAPADLAEALLRNLGHRALAAAPPGSLPTLLAALPDLPPSAAEAFAGVPPGLDDEACHEAVLAVLAGAIRERHLPAMAGLVPGTAGLEAGLAEVLADLRHLAVAGLRLRQQAEAGTRTAASAALWSLHGDLAACATYAQAALAGYRQGALDRTAADTFLKDLADTLQALVYALLIETSAVPLEVSILFQGTALPRLAQAQARAAGIRPVATPSRACLACCSLASLENEARIQAISEAATRDYLAAYLEAVIGSSVSAVLDLTALARLDAARSAVPGNGTVAPASIQDPGAAPAVGAAPPCGACTCDLASSLQQIQLARLTRAGGHLTLCTYTLNLVVKGLRIAIAARP